MHGFSTRTKQPRSTFSLLNLPSHTGFLQRPRGYRPPAVHELPGAADADGERACSLSSQHNTLISTFSSRLPHLHAPTHPPKPAHTHTHTHTHTHLLQGFSKDHEAIDLLRYKSFLVERKLTDKELTSPDLLDIIHETFEVMTPFLNELNDLAELN